MVNVNGRSSLGYGDLELLVTDLSDLHCVNPNLMINYISDLDKSILESDKWDILDPLSARCQIDSIVYDILELTQGERDGVYKTVTELVTTRLQKART